MTHSNMIQYLLFLLFNKPVLMPYSLTSLLLCRLTTHNINMLTLLLFLLLALIHQSQSTLYSLLPNYTVT